MSGRNLKPWDLVKTGVIGIRATRARGKLTAFDMFSPCQYKIVECSCIASTYYHASEKIPYTKWECINPLDNAYITRLPQGSFLYPLVTF